MNDRAASSVNDRVAWGIAHAIPLRHVWAVASAALASCLYATEAMASDLGTLVQPDWLWVIPVIILLAAMAFVGRLYFHRRKEARGAVSYDPEELKINDATFVIGSTISSFAALGVIAILVASLGLSPPVGISFAGYFGIDLLVAAAAGAMGAVLGFIFGIPRTMDPANRAAVANAAAQSGPAAATSAVMAANTNLERVSDWLTTLLVGATLVQIREIPGWLRDLADFIGTGSFTNGKVVPFVAVYFFGLAFLGVYLITRLYLTTALKQTLGGLVGGVGVGIGVTDVAAVQKVLSNALASADPEAMRLAIGVVERTSFQANDRFDSALNGDLVRVLAKYIATGKADNNQARFAQLKSALGYVKTDANLAKLLKADFDSKFVTTGDVPMDTELGKQLA